MSGVVTAVTLPLHLRGARLAALLTEPTLGADAAPPGDAMFERPDVPPGAREADCRGGPCGRPSNIDVAAQANGPAHGPPPTQSTPVALRAGLLTLRLLARARLPGWRNTCLYRAALRTLILRREGKPAVLRLGARSGDGPDAAPVAAHAWVELLGAPIPEEARPYTTLRRTTSAA